MSPDGRSLAHPVLSADVWRRSERQERDGALAVEESSAEPTRGCASKRSGVSGSVHSQPSVAGCAAIDHLLRPHATGPGQLEDGSISAAGHVSSAKMSQFILRDGHAERSSLRVSRRQGWPSCFSSSLRAAPLALDSSIIQILSMVPGVAHVRVNPGYFADNYLQLIDYAAHLGVFPTITGNGKDAPPSNEDIARVVVAVLVDPDKHAGKVYRPTGPALLSGNDMAEILSRVLGRKVRRVDLPWRLFLKAARTANVGAFLVSNLRYYVEDHSQGAFALGAPTNHVLEVTGRPAEDFETTARRYAARPGAQRNFTNWLRTFVAFMRTPLVPGYNPERLDRELTFLSRQRRASPWPMRAGK